MSDSIQKDFNNAESEVTESDVLHLAMDPVLAKRLEKKFILKIHLSFNKETNKVELSPPVEEWL